jgi:hypothetical protein
MLTKAMEIATCEGADRNITFVQGALTDLGRYRDREFDLVISFDAPVSYTYPKHTQVLSVLIRIANKAVIVSVSSRLGGLPYLFNPVQKHQYIIDKSADDPVVRWYVRNGTRQLANWRPNFPMVRQLLTTGLIDDPDELYQRMEQGETPWPVNYGFLPDELTELLQNAGLRNINLSGPGALARSIPRDILRKLLLEEAYKSDFLNQCYEFDSQPWERGYGKDNLVASGVR